jgi:hypothetical protein
MKLALGGTVIAGIVGMALVGSPAAAEEAKAAISASMLLEIVSAPGPSRVSDFDRLLREAGPRPAPSLGDQLAADGAGAGHATITVKNPCPPGAAHYEPPPLPGRRVRN